MKQILKQTSFKHLSFNDILMNTRTKNWSESILLKQQGVHVIKATQYTRLKATPKNTGKKATKIYRNIGYNEYTGSKATAFLNTQEKRLHFLNIQEKRLHFLNIQEKGYTF